MSKAVAKAVEIVAHDAVPGWIVLKFTDDQDGRTVVSALNTKAAFKFAHDMAKAYATAFGDMLPKEYQPVANALTDVVETLDPKE
jgi:hypothetical protein